jgi:transcriptional regulator with XRE-family HTH domain
MSTIPCYLRTLRREWGLTQEELARLIHGSRRQRVSGVERMKMPPKAAEILAYSVLFGLPPGDIFPAFYGEVEETLIARAYEFDEALATDASRRAERKRKLLRSALDRATGKRLNPARL